MKIYLIRHTAVDVAPGICYGQTDVPLKKTFESEALLVKDKLKNLDVETAFSGPLSRCTGLARFCGFGNCVLDKRLKELNFGNWETRNWNDLDMSVWNTDRINTPAPNGESFMQMYNRVASFFEEIKINNTFTSVAVFTHGGVISCARVYFQQADIRKTFDLMPEYGEVVKFNL